jgi:GLPGLI family protein
MQKTLILGILLCIATSMAAQDIQGIVTYNRKVNWITIMSNLPYMTSEEIDRNKLTWGDNSKNKGTNFELFFKKQKSLYTYKPEKSERGYSRNGDKFVLIRDYKNKTTQDLVETLGKTYKIEDDAPKYRWKILNEIREIEGFLCMKAETTDTIKDQVIHAWFTDKIPFYGGPEGFGGLPGLILEIDINNGSSLITATNIDLETAEVKLPIPKKMKGKEITYTELNKKLSKYIKDSIEGEKNPYWRVRY